MQLFQIILTSAFTILGGVFIFVAGQIAVKFFIEPIHELRKLIGEIGDSLIFYANVDFGDKRIFTDEMRKASDTYRRQASQLMARTYAIPGYGFFQKWRIVPRLEDVVEASQNLIGLSNAREIDNFDRFRNEVIKRLKYSFK